MTEVSTTVLIRLSGELERPSVRAAFAASSMGEAYSPYAGVIPWTLPINTLSYT